MNDAIVHEESRPPTTHTLIVNGYDGEMAVEVVAVRTVRESELGLPVERYKRVVRKVLRLVLFC